MTYRPHGSRVLVKRDQEETTTKSGIIIPGISVEKPLQGEVVMTGPGDRNKHGVVVPMIIQPGDKILFDKHTGTEVKLESETFLIMKEEEVLGIFTGEPN